MYVRHSSELSAKGLALEIYSTDPDVAVLRMPEGDDVKMARKHLENLERVPAHLGASEVNCYNAAAIRAILGKGAPLHG